LTNGVSYTFTVTATNSAGTGSASVASNSVTPRATQTITFANPGAQNFGTAPTLSATSDSGLTPTFTSATTGVCTVTTGGALTFVTAGTCTVSADQPGNGTYLPAVQVSRSFTVNGQTTATGTVPGMTGTVTATLSGGGASCTLVPADTVFASPGSAPAGYVLPNGGFQFHAAGCVGSVTMTLAYPQALPAGVQFWKFGPATAGAAVSTWFQWSGATPSPDRKTVGYTILDNGIGDADPANGSIRDPFAPALPGAGALAGIPTLSEWALALLSLALGVLGWRNMRVRERIFPR
jgi:hypothetical protein